MFELHHGDSLDVMRGMADNSIDAIVTDPPYGLSFMGKRWDYDVPSEELWRECLRVLKPGGHLLAFAGTRTQHRMAVRIEDAGFEIRDMIAWVYGSGFPKSLDVSKAIDKQRDDRPEVLAVTSRLADLAEAAGISRADIDAHMGTSDMGGWWLSRLRHRCACPSVDNWTRLRDFIPGASQLDGEVWRLNGRKGLPGEAWESREVIGTKTSGIANKEEGPRHTIGASKAVLVDITAPATDTARQWQGWGTALKPALEPITVARKPLIGTVAENVLTWGTGGVNVDGCRVHADDVSTERKRHGGGIAGNGSSYELPDSKNIQPQGRWPANLIHDGSDEVVGLFPQTGPAKASQRGERTGAGTHAGWARESHKGFDSVRGHNDNGGSAARFFYCAKASKRDRNEGLDGFEAKFAPTMGDGIGGKEHNEETATKKLNHHPTVKPTDLMRYLCRLVTPPNGTVLDPFMGSGSTGKAAVLEGFRFIGIEREAEYIDIARARIDHVTKEPNLWQS